MIRAAAGLVACLLLGVGVGWMAEPRVDRPARLDRFAGPIDRAAGRFGVDRALIRAVIRAESGGRAEVVSGKGAVGLMQLMPSTAREYAADLGVQPSSLKDPEVNILLGTCHLARLLSQFDDDRILALAAYNTGAGRVRGWLRSHPAWSAAEVIDRCASRETRGYVARVERYLRRESK